MKVTFLGLGIMGSRMAKNLSKGGIELTVWNRSKTPFEALGKSGIRIAEEASTAVQDAEIVISMLAHPEAVEAVFLGSEGALSHMKKGALWIDCSTVNPSFSLRSTATARALGIDFLDAPVAGTLPHAENAELVFFVGGEDALLQKAEALFNLMGRKIMHIGESGKGSSFKMLVNALLAQNMLVFAETLLLGEKMGLDKDFLINTLPNLVVSAPFTKAKAEMIRKDDYSVMFPLELMLKDLHLAAVCGYENKQPLFLANTAKELYAQAVQNGLGREDFAAIYKSLSDQN